LLEDNRRRLQKSREFWNTRNFGEAYREAERALRPLRILMRAQWEQAVRGMDTPVASPYAVSYYTLPKHWPFMAQINQGTLGPNLLPGGDFEILPERTQEGWKERKVSLDDVDLFSGRVSELAPRKEDPKDNKDAKDSKDSKTAKSPPKTQPEQVVEGKQCAMLQIKPQVGKEVPQALERTMVALVSPDVKLPPGTLVQVSGQVYIPESISASPDGALLYDSAGGEPLAIRLTASAGWKKYTVYRRVPESGTINVTLALTGLGTVYFDDIRIETRAPANVPVDNNGQPR
jgi:hypothetical protein